MGRMEMEARHRAAQTYLTGRSPPPRFRPFVIIGMVLIIGAIIIGLILTVLAYFPGYSAKGVDSLRIVGPIILAVAILILFGLLLEIYMRSEREKELVTKSVNDFHSSRMTLASRQSGISAHSVGSSNHASSQPPKSILKNPSTSSSYSDTRSGNRSYERDSSGSDLSDGCVNGQISMDPTGSARRNKRRKHKTPYQNNGYTTSERAPERHPSGMEGEVAGTSTPNMERRHIGYDAANTSRDYSRDNDYNGGNNYTSSVAGNPKHVGNKYHDSIDKGSSRDNIRNQGYSKDAYDSRDRGYSRDNSRNTQGYSRDDLRDRGYSRDNSRDAQGYSRDDLRDQGYSRDQSYSKEQGASGDLNYSRDRIISKEEYLNEVSKPVAIEQGSARRWGQNKDGSQVANVSDTYREYGGSRGELDLSYNDRSFHNRSYNERPTDHRASPNSSTQV